MYTARIIVMLYLLGNRGEESVIRERLLVELYYQRARVEFGLESNLERSLFGVATCTTVHSRSAEPRDVGSLSVFHGKSSPRMRSIALPLSRPPPHSLIWLLRPLKSPACLRSSPPVSRDPRMTLMVAMTLALGGNWPRPSLPSPPHSVSATHPGLGF